MQPISEQIRNLGRYVGSDHPMRRDDYRRPMRAAMIRDAKELLLISAGCPVSRVGHLAQLPMADVSAKLRHVEMIRGGRR